MLHSKQFSKNITFTIIGGLVLVLILLLFFYFGQRMKKFRSTEHYYSIKYPADWEMEEKMDGVDVIFFSPLENEVDLFRENVNIVVQDMTGRRMSLAEYSQKAIVQMKVVFKDNLIILESKPVKFGGRDGHKFVYIGKGPEQDIKVINYWTIAGKKAFQFGFTSTVAQFERHSETAEKMAESFRLE